MREDWNLCKYSISIYFLHLLAHRCQLFEQQQQQQKTKKKQDQNEVLFQNLIHNNNNIFEMLAELYQILCSHMNIRDNSTF